MTSYSSADLVDRVLKDLGLIAAEESASNEDYAFVLQTIQSEAASMAVRGVPMMNGSDESIPLEYLTAISRRIGLAVGPGYGLFSSADAVVAIPQAEEIITELSIRRSEPLEAAFDTFGAGRRGTYQGD